MANRFTSQIVLAVTLLFSHLVTAQLVGLPIPIPLPGGGGGGGGGSTNTLCTKDQLIAETQDAQAKLKARPARYGVMAYALKRTISELQSNNDITVVPTITILTPTNSALGIAGITPAILSALANNKISDALKVNILTGGYSFDDLKAMAEGQQMDTANSDVKVARYKKSKGTRVAVGVVDSPSRQWAEVIDKDLYKGSCILIQGTSRVLRP
eukprot:TRINITY_DN5299_c0_g1_i2.p1 TRINITY_DN5299_c0_g1~~TRINITY_DN5299_c0_g1_i2.p1  ORF type:complete len:212 (-),score=2.16 TRINITY_DN5299_c0_g1_i2:173-808(-)